MRKEELEFLKRADAHIDLANSQTSPEISVGKVSVSFMYALARYNSYVSAWSYKDAEDFKNNKQKVMDYYCDKYKEMLEEQLDIYANDFDKLIKR